MELYEWSAAEVLEGFARRTLSPVEYLEALIARSAIVEPVVNALGDTYFDEARAAARVAERRYAVAPDSARRLEGLPIAVKDEAEISGRRTTNGSLIWEHELCTRTEPMVQRLLDAGAFVHARTLTPEFSVTLWTMSRLWGVTRNPWNPTFDVGGSSGGSGAALASGTTPLATGSDIGGSIRVPASSNGVVGYKPPHGRVPQLAPWGLDQWSHLGPLARSVADVALMYEVMTGFHPDAAFTTSPTEPIDATDCDVRGLRIALSADLGDWPTVAPVRAALDRTAQVLRAAGAVVDEVDLVIERSLARRASDAHCAALFAASIADTVRGNEHLADASTLRWLESIERAPTYAEGLVAEGEIWSRLGVVFDRFDALLCPAMCIPAYTAGVDHSASPIVVDGREWDALHDICPAEVFNATGTCPVLAVPIGRDEHGVPIGTQIVARPFDEPTVFRIAARLERDQPWPRVAPAPTAADRSDARGD